MNKEVVVAEELIGDGKIKYKVRCRRRRGDRSQNRNQVPAPALGLMVVISVVILVVVVGVTAMAIPLNAAGEAINNGTCGLRAAYNAIIMDIFHGNGTTLFIPLALLVACGIVYITISSLNKR